MTDQPEPQLTRIQQKNRELILEGALTVFSASGFRGATIDQIRRRHLPKNPSRCPT